MKAGTDVELVNSALTEAGDEALPDARAAAWGHGGGVGVPAIEIANDGDALGIGRPDGEPGAGTAVEGDEVGTHLLIEAVVAALVEKMEVHVGEEGGTFESQWRHGGSLLIAEKP